jgi:transcriptional regulator with XRE-family HTH domain
MPSLRKRAYAQYEKALASELRDRLGLTQQSFATILGLSTVSVSRWEHRKTLPTDASRALIGLLARAMEKSTPDTIIATLGALKAEDELGRIVTLVHLGD